MKSLFKKFMGRAAPTHALPEDGPAMMIGQARERVSALPQGRALMDFLDDADYTLGIADISGSTRALCNPITRHITFSSNNSVDEITGDLPHEAFHAVQHDQVPIITNFAACFLTEGKPAPPVFEPGKDVDLIRPDEMLYAYNLLEMGAYAAQSHMISGMMHDAGDVAVYNAARKVGDYCLETYEGMLAMPSLASLRFGTRQVLDNDEQDIFDIHDRRSVAATAAAYGWFWATHDGSDCAQNGYQRLSYHNSKVKTALKWTFNETASYFGMKKNGHDFRFRSLEDREIRLLGQGCGLDVFALPEFDDIRGADYKNAATAENRAKIMKINQNLGLS